MSPEERKQAAQACFKANPKADRYYQTADGQCFRHWHDANEHSKSLIVRNIEEVSRVEKPEAKKESHQEKIDKINACKDALELTEIKIGNKEHPDVAAAFNAKLKEFSDEKARKEAEAIAAGVKTKEGKDK